MKFKSFLEARRGSTSFEGYLELHDEESGETVEVTVEFNGRWVPAEREDGHTYQSAGYEHESSHVVPFTFVGKRYAVLEPELIPYVVDFSADFRKQHGAMIEKAVEEVNAVKQAKSAWERQSDYSHSTQVLLDVYVDEYLFYDAAARE